MKHLYGVVVFSLISVSLFQGVSGDAPGDEDDLCTQESITNATVLLDSYNYINLLGGVFPPAVWKSVSHQSGDDGWTVNRSAGGICRQGLQACDYENEPGVDNWLFTQYIHYQDAKEVFIEVSYDLSVCRNSHSCSERRGYVYHYGTNRSDPEEHTDSTKYHNFGSFDWTGSRYNVRLARPNSDRGFYLGFRDRGTCGTINRVRVYYKVCPSKVDGLTYYPTLPLPAQNNQEPNVAYAYCSYNSYNSVASGYKAYSDGRCEYGARCECRAGYEEVTTGTAAICRACLRGQYRSSSNSNCRSCPSNTVTSGVAVAMCPCLAGYYRTTYEGPNNACSAPPSDCQNLVVSKENYNQVTVTWSRPSVTGRSDFYYNIYYSSSEDDGKFTQHNTQQYIVSSSQVSYTVSGLSPFTSYTIRVIVGNGVSDQDPTGKDNRLCEVNATTLPNDIAQFDILSSLVLWNASSDTDGDQYLVRYNKTEDHYDPNDSNNETLYVNYVDSEAVYTVQVRQQDESHWSKPIKMQVRAQSGSDLMPSTEETTQAPPTTEGTTHAPPTTEGTTPTSYYTTMETTQAPFQCSSTELFQYYSNSPNFEDPCGDAIKSIVIYYNGYVNSIQVTYNLTNGAYSAPTHGYTYGARTVVNFDEGEEIVAISGGWRSNGYLVQLKFITMKPNGDHHVYGPYGYYSAHEIFAVNANVVSFFGGKVINSYYNYYLDYGYIYALGFKTIPSNL